MSEQHNDIIDVTTKTIQLKYTLKYDILFWVCLFVYLFKETLNKAATVFSRTGARKA